MTTVGNYGSGPYAVAVEVVNDFGTEDRHVRRFEDAKAALAYYEEQRKEDGPLVGSEPLCQRTSMNRRLRESSRKMV